MANALYAKGREAFLGGDIGADSDDLRLILSDAADYTKNLSTDDFLNDVAAGARVAVSSALASKTITNGTLDAADKTLSAVTGDVAEEVILYKHTGAESTSNLIANWDTGTGLPVTPNGGDIVIAFNASGLFTL